MAVESSRNLYAATDRKTLGALIKKEREHLKFTQDYITSKTGLTRKQIISIEKGTTNYRMETLLKYLNAINLFIVLKYDIRRSTN